LEGVVKTPVSRRNLLACAPLALGACAHAEQAYFGKTDPPRSQRLVYVLDQEPGSLDPALGFDERVTLSLFEGLTNLHPVNGGPIAGLATHFDVTADGLGYTFWLRGHARPGGRLLPDSAGLPPEFVRHPPARADVSPSRWNDGVPITAHDFVFSWRRAADPVTASPMAFLLHDIRNAEEITAGKLSPEKLAVRALDDFTLQVELNRPAPSFLELVSGGVFCPVPRHAIEAAGKAWTEPGRMVSNGAFVLKERRPNDRIVLTRNPGYYDSGRVALQELAFLVVRENTAGLNLYKAGIGAMMQPWTPWIMSTLRRKKDFRPQGQYASRFWIFNTAAPPLNDVRVRYAFNMATDKRPIAELAAAGTVPLSGLIPETAGFSSPRTLPVSIDGTTYDVLSFDPQAARALLAKAAHPIPKRLEYFCSTDRDSILWAQVLKQQWKNHIGIELDIVAVEFAVFVESNVNGRFRHIAESGAFANYVDPAWFLDLFGIPGGYGTSWSDPRYNQALADAHATTDRSLRMAMLAECERMLLQAMPIMPLCQVVQAKLRKPFVKGLGSNLLNREQFKYAWIDTHWRPQ
jgi:ABC-type oligopeptide transport system substrate-binding subunit